MLNLIFTCRQNHPLFRTFLYSTRICFTSQCCLRVKIDQCDCDTCINSKVFLGLFECLYNPLCKSECFTLNI